MDYLNLIQNAIIVDQDGDFIGYVRGFEVNGHRMTLNVTLHDGDEGDDDGGQRVDVDFTPDPGADSGQHPMLKVVGGRDG